MTLISVWTSLLDLKKMIKSILIFMLQACIVSLLTVLIGGEAFLWHQDRQPKPEEIECPVVDNNIIPTEVAGKIACINGAAHIIDRSGLVALWDENRAIIICTESTESIVEGYHLWKRDQ